jgi:hypothetical protein
MSQVSKILAQMDPEGALGAIGEALKSIFPIVSEEARSAFLLQIVGESGADKVSSMVHL